MRNLASVQKIKDLTPIQDADRIELAHVLGWQCVVQKGKFHAGDPCVYFEVDSFLPLKPEFEFLRSSSYHRSDLLGEGFRLKTMKFRGEISQGLVMPVAEVLTEEQIDSLRDASGNIPDGTDVTDMLGVRKWEMPEMATGQGTTIGSANGFIPITDEARIQSYPEVLKEFAGLDYYITTKLDGSSHSIMVDENNEFHVFGHHYELKDDGNSSFYEWLKANKIPEKARKIKDDFCLNSLSVQGEWCGGGIQNNPLKLRSPNWFVFTVNENRKRVGMNEMVSVAKLLGVSTVPIQEVDHDLPKMYPTEAALLERCEQQTGVALYPGIPEGIVIRPVEPVYSPTLHASLSIKVKSNRYLLKHDNA